MPDGSGGGVRCSATADWPKDESEQMAKMTATDTPLFMT